MTQIRKIRAGWKSGSDQHRISAAIDKYLWIWLQEKPNKNRTINEGLRLLRLKEETTVEDFIKYCHAYEQNLAKIREP